MAYLDHAATTPVRPEALEAMLPWLTDRVGNPSGAHRAARGARRALDDARDVLAHVLGAEPGDIVFTGGGTEADNLAVFGVLEHAGDGGGPAVAVCSAVEHHAVLEPVERTGGRVVGVGSDGVVDLGGLAAALDQSVAVVSVMAANNEVGTVQPLADVVALVSELAPQAVVHTDAVQAVAWLDVAALVAGAHLVSVSAHKFGGPQGVGALVVRPGVGLRPRLLGGGQERGRRSGTQNVAGVAGMAAAAAAAHAERAAVVERVGKLRDRLADGLLAAVPSTTETGVRPGPAGPDRSAKVAANCHLCFEGVESEALVVLLEAHDVMASAGASCSSGAQAPSHVLAAMGVPGDLALGSLRLSLGASSTDADVDTALAAIPAAVERLRGFA